MMSKKSPQLRFEGFTDDWEERKLGEFVIDYVEKTTTQNQFPVLTSSQQQGIVLQETYFANRQVTTDNNIGYYVLPRGYFTFRNRSDNDVFIFNRNDIIDKGIISYFYPVFTLKNSDSDFFLKRINNGIKRQVSIQAEGTGQHVLSMKKFKNIISMFPSLEEQEKIGSFFKQLDNTIALHQRKLDLLKEQKKGYLQKMFPKAGEKIPELRFAGFADDWEQRRLGDIFKKDTQKNKDLEFHSDSVISVAKMKLSPPSAKSSDEYMKTYNKIRKGNVAFEGHTNDEFPNGRFVLNDCQDGIVSHIYDVYSAVDEYNNEFMKRYINNPDVMRKILINATSSARMMKSLNSIEFLKQSILLPILSEQQKIGKFFYQLDNTITLHQRKLDLLKEQKKGFLQKMFV